MIVSLSRATQSLWKLAPMKTTTIHDFVKITISFSALHVNYKLLNWIDFNSCVIQMEVFSYNNTKTAMVDQKWK
jgi:hypothetical protein